MDKGFQSIVKTQIFLGFIIDTHSPDFSFFLLGGWQGLLGILCWPKVTSFFGWGCWFTMSPAFTCVTFYLFILKPLLFPDLFLIGDLTFPFSHGLRLDRNYPFDLCGFHSWCSLAQTLVHAFKEPHPWMVGSLSSPLNSYPKSKPPNQLKTRWLAWDCPHGSWQGSKRESRVWKAFCSVLLAKQVPSLAQTPGVVR